MIKVIHASAFWGDAGGCRPAGRGGGGGPFCRPVVVVVVVVVRTGEEVSFLGQRAAVATAPVAAPAAATTARVTLDMVMVGPSILKSGVTRWLTRSERARPAL